MSKTKSPSNPPPQDYESAMVELETIVRAMEAGELPLQKAFEHYQRGFALLQFCQTQLQSLEEQVKIFEEGQIKNFSLSKD